MPSDETEPAQAGPFAIQVLRFISSIGHYGMLVGLVQAAYGVYQWDKIPIMIAVGGGIFPTAGKCFGIGS